MESDPFWWVGYGAGMKRIVLGCVGLITIKLLILLLGYRMAYQTGAKLEWCAWDCAYYQEIATQGYSFQQGKHGTMAFFPLFPKSVALLSSIFHLPFIPMGILFNFCCFGLGMILFMRWCQILGMRAYWLPALLLTLDRHSLWSLIPYTEALFLLIILIFIHLTRRDSPFASLVAGLASGTRLVGIAPIAAWGLGHSRYYLRHPFRAGGSLVIGLSGVMLFFGYLEVAHGNWQLSFITTSFWGRYFSLSGIWGALWVIVSRAYFPTVILLPLSIWVLIRPPASLSLTLIERLVFAFLVLLPMVNSISVCMTRFLSLILPGYIALAYWLEWLWFDSRKKIALLIGSVFLGEFYWQAFLLKKFLLYEVFFWAA